MNALGRGRLGCIVVLLVGAVFVYVSFQVVPVYLNKVEFDEDLGLIVARAGANGWSDSLIQEHVKEAAHIRGFRLVEEKTRIERTSPLAARPRIKLEVVYTRDVHFPAYTHHFEFHATKTSIVGRL